MRNGGLIVSGVAGGIGVLLGAFGAHALRDTLGESRLATWTTGVQYHLVHALALLALCALPATRALALARWAFVAGILLFSGSLYALALTEARWFGAVTPVGGVAFLLGWAAIAGAGARRRG